MVKYERADCCSEESLTARAAGPIRIASRRTPTVYQRRLQYYVGTYRYPEPFHRAFPPFSGAIQAASFPIMHSTI